METRLLQKEDFKKLYKAFCLVFSNYKVEFNLLLEEFDYRIHKKLNIDYDLSVARFDGDRMIGFLLHTSNLYEGIPTAFNGGTGVIPSFRNQRTGEELYQFLLPKIASKAIERIILEVIDTNDHAIRLYEKTGFSFRRTFLCYKLEKKQRLSLRGNISDGSLDDLDDRFTDFSPSFIDSREQLMRGNEKVLIAKKGKLIVGYIIFQPSLGRVSQIAVSRVARREGVGKNLIALAQSKSRKSLTIMNVPEDELEVQKFVASCGFENQVTQFEMELII